MADLDVLWGKIKRNTDSKSLLKKHFSENIYDKLKEKKTTLGGTLADCIRSGAQNFHTGVGVFSSCPEGYTVFADLMEPVIKDYHKVTQLNHPACDFGDLDNLGFDNLDPSGDLIVSTRVRVGRSHASYGFPPTTNIQQRLEMEKKSQTALEGLKGELKGTYYPLKGMTADTQKQLTEDHFLFNGCDRSLKAAGVYDDWPIGRGIYYNDKKTFLTWVNEEDHIRIISMQKGGDLAAVYRRLVVGTKELEKKLDFARSTDLGYLNYCPSNLGTALRASVLIKIPNLAQNPEFNEICERLNLQTRGTNGVYTEVVDGVYDISNKRRLGLSEIEVIQEMRNGVEKIIKLEQAAKLA